MFSFFSPKKKIHTPPPHIPSASLIDDNNISLTPITPRSEKILTYQLNSNNINNNVSKRNGNNNNYYSDSSMEYDPNGTSNLPINLPNQYWWKDEDKLPILRKNDIDNIKITPKKDNNTPINYIENSISHNIVHNITYVENKSTISTTNITFNIENELNISENSAFTIIKKNTSPEPTKLIFDDLIDNNKAASKLNSDCDHSNCNDSSQPGNDFNDNNDVASKIQNDSDHSILSQSEIITSELSRDNEANTPGQSVIEADISNDVQIGVDNSNLTVQSSNILINSSKVNSRNGYSNLSDQSLNDLNCTNDVKVDNNVCNTSVQSGIDFEKSNLVQPEIICKDLSINNNADKNDIDDFSIPSQVNISYVNENDTETINKTLVPEINASNITIDSAPVISPTAHARKMQLLRMFSLKAKDAECKSIDSENSSTLSQPKKKFSLRMKSIDNFNLSNNKVEAIASLPIQSPVQNSIQISNLEDSESSEDKANNDLIILSREKSDRERNISLVKEMTQIEQVLLFYAF